MKNLEEAVKMAGTVKNLCKYFNRHKSFQPFEIVEVAEEVGFDKAKFKEKMIALQTQEDSKPKVKEHTMVLFSHPDFGTKFLADLDDRVIVEPGWVFHVEVDLKAKTPAALSYGLDNPNILQKIKDAGDFSGMMTAIQKEYVSLLDKHYSEDNDNLDSIEQKLQSFIEAQKDAAIQRAKDCATKEFGLEAQISATARSRAFQCTLGVVTVSLGAMATAAGFAIALPAGILGLHGTLKSLDSTFRTFRMVRNGFEKNMCAAESCYQRAGAVAKTMGANSGQIGARVWETAVGDLGNSFKKGNQFLGMAEGDLLKFEKAANDISSGLSKYVLKSQSLSTKMSELEGALLTLKSDPSVAAEKISSMEANLESLRGLVGSIESEIDTIINHCEHQNVFVAGCSSRIAKVKEIEALCKPSTGAQAFLLAYDALELTAGVIGGGFAAGKGFTGEKLVGGLNPMNEKAWVTVGNFMGHTNAMIGAVSLAKDIYDTCTDTD